MISRTDIANVLADFLEADRESYDVGLNSSSRAESLIMCSVAHLVAARIYQDFLASDGFKQESLDQIDYLSLEILDTIRDSGLTSPPAPEKSSKSSNDNQNSEECAIISLEDYRNKKVENTVD